MSTRHCPNCQCQTVQERIHPPHEESGETVYIVGWMCKTCGHTNDVTRYDLTIALSHTPPELLERAHQITKEPFDE